MAESKTSLIVLPKVKDGINNKGVYSFTIEDTNVSVVNAVRRTILSDIPMVVFDTDKENIEFSVNTCKLHNEILKQRLGCIPVHIRDFDGIENLVVECEVNNDTDSLVYVTTKHFQILNKNTNKYLTEDQVDKIFPPDELTKDYILFTRLRPKISNDIPGEMIKFKANFKVGTAKQDGMYNVVSTCAYGNTEDKVEQHNQWQAIAEQLESQGLIESQVEYERKNWHTLQAKRFYIQNSFDFKLQTVGVFSNMEIIHKALDILISKLNNIAKNCEDEVIELNREATAMNNSVDIKLVGEDYTIGKVLEYVLHEEDYKKNRTLSYVGFIKKHPHDDYSIIRIAFNDSEDIDVENDSNVYKMLKFACEISKNLFVNIKEYF
jgi:DNA-directed RNA polymerase subunit L